jgi:hypothetical protein
VQDDVSGKHHVTSSLRWRIDKSQLARKPAMASAASYRRSRYLNVLRIEDKGVVSEVAVAKFIYVYVCRGG